MNMLKGPLKLGILIMGITMLAVSPLSAADQTDVVIIRTNSSVESNRPVTVYINGNRVGTLMPGRNLSTRVNNGICSVQATLPQPGSKVISSEYVNFTADDSRTISVTINVVEEAGRIPLTKVPVVILTVE